MTLNPARPGRFSDPERSAGSAGSNPQRPQTPRCVCDVELFPGPPRGLARGARGFARTRGSRTDNGIESLSEIVLAKGIRVNQLAKELGVESKSILTKLRDEGLGERAPNHMSVLPLGLAESVREWFSAGLLGDGGGGTAVQTAPPVEA